MCRAVEIVLRTETPEGIEVVLPALVYAKIVEEHAAVADLGRIDRTIREPDDRRRDPVRTVSASFAEKPPCGSSWWWDSARCLPSS